MVRPAVIGEGIPPAGAIGERWRTAQCGRTRRTTVGSLSLADGRDLLAGQAATSASDIGKSAGADEKDHHREHTSHTGSSLSTPHA